MGNEYLVENESNNDSLNWIKMKNLAYLHINIDRCITKRDIKRILKSLDDGDLKFELMNQLINDPSKSSKVIKLMELEHIFRVCESKDEKVVKIIKD